MLSTLIAAATSGAAPGTTEHELMRLHLLAEARGMLHLPKLISEKLSNCKHQYETDTGRAHCLDDTRLRAQAILSCETDPKRRLEMAEYDRRLIKENQDRLGSSSAPDAVLERFGRVTRAANALSTTGSALPEWSMSAYSARFYDASSGEGGQILMSSRFWAADSPFSLAEIEAVFAHEAAHVVLGHSLKRACLAYEHIGADSEDLESAVIAVNSEGIFPSSAYGRRRADTSMAHELEADEMALDILRHLGSDPMNVARALLILNRIAPSEAFPSSTHPTLSSRAARISELLSRK